MSKTNFLGLVFALTLGIVLGVSATGLAYAGSEELTNVLSQYGSAGSKPDYHNAAYEDCEQNFDSHHSFEEDFDHSAHHSAMH